MIRNQCIKIEDIRKNGYYSITFSPKAQPTDIGIIKFLSWYDLMGRLIRQIKNPLLLYIERSTNNSCIFHFHGFIRIVDVPQFVLNDIDWLKEHGHYEIDTIDDNSIWQGYCHKQKPLFQAIAEKSLYGYPLDNTIEDITEV